MFYIINSIYLHLLKNEDYRKYKIIDFFKILAKFNFYNKIIDS